MNRAFGLYFFCEKKIEKSVDNIPNMVYNIIVTGDGRKGEKKWKKK